VAEVFDGVPTRFPGLREIEARTLERFARTVAPRGKFTVNLKFPFPEDRLPLGLSDPEKRMFLENKAKRIEGVLELPTEVWLIEVKERLVPSALGELLLYEGLYRQHFPTGKKLVKVCVATEDDALLRPSFEAAGVRVFII